NNLNNEIEAFIKLNEITNKNNFIISLIEQGFTILKYGSSPNNNIVEKIIENPINFSDDKAVEYYKKLYEDTLNELTTEKNKIVNLTNQLEQIKKKKDIYGE